jgi:hypothetical protein
MRGVASDVFSESAQSTRRLYKLTGQCQSSVLVSVRHESRQFSVSSVRNESSQLVSEEISAVQPASVRLVSELQRVADMTRDEDLTPAVVQCSADRSSW